MVKNTAANAGELRNAGLISGLGRSPGGGHGSPLQYSGLEEGMAALSSILAWRIPWTGEPDGLRSLGLERVRKD